MVKIYNSKEEYSPAEAAELAQAFSNLEEKAQGGILTIEETRLRVAYIRFLREDNFKIAIVKEPKAKKEKVPKEPKAPKEPKVKVARATTKKDPKLSSIERAGALLFKRNSGQTLTEEENTFLDQMLTDPNTL